MTTCYKLLSPDLTAYGRYQYTPGVTARVEYTGQLCSPGVLHVYDTPEDAVFFDPIHSERLPGGVLWECEYEGPSVSDGTKRGVGELTLIREIPVPTLSTDVRIERAIHAVLEVCQDEAWRTWALRWLDGSDRSADYACAVMLVISASVSLVRETYVRAASWSALAAASSVADGREAWAAVESARAVESAEMLRGVK